MFEPERLTYLIGLVISIGGLGFIDWRFRLVLARDAPRGLRTLGLGIGFFLLWDFLNLWAGSFVLVPARFTTHLMVLPGMPLEEILFFLLLCYQTLILWTLSADKRDA